MRTSIVIATLATASLAACAADTSSTLTIHNNSSYALIEINVAPVDQTTWGQDLLGVDVLNPGDSFVVSKIDCGTYDIRLIDHDNAMCVLTDVDLCADNATWSLDDTELAACHF